MRSGPMVEFGLDIGTRWLCQEQEGRSIYLRVASRRVHDARRLTVPGLASVMLIACTIKAQGREGAAEQRRE